MFPYSQNTIEEWSIIFIIAGVAYIIPAIVFILFGSGNVQSWNENKSASQENVESIENAESAKNAKNLKNIEK